MDREAFREQRTIPVHPLDSLAQESVTPGELLDRIRAGEATCARRRDGSPVLGAATVVRHDPRTKPKSSNRSPRPLCQASSYADDRTLGGIFRAFCRRFWSASDSLRNGDRSQPFPTYSFPRLRDERHQRWGDSMLGCRGRLRYAVACGPRLVRLALHALGVAGRCLHRPELPGVK